MEDDKQRLLMIGGSGLVGSRVRELLSDYFTIVNYSLEMGVDITRSDTLTPLLNESPTIVLHLAAKADVDGCEKDKPLGEDGAAWKMNVLGVRNIVSACERVGHKILYVSTDFVFDGESPPPGGYAEEDIPNPQNWYAQTKYEGEKLVTRSSHRNIVMRIAYPYRSQFAEKADFVRAILSRLQAGKAVAAVTDHLMTPTFIDDIAEGVRALIINDAEGIYHVVGNTSLSPLDAVNAIARVFSIENPQITETTRAEFFAHRAPRPFNLTLENDKIKRLHVPMHSFDEGLVLMKSQMEGIGSI